MKFTLPIQKADNFLAGFRHGDGTWESRAAKIAVISQGITGGIALVWGLRLLPPKVPLWYSKPWGEERLASPLFLLLPIATAIAVYCINRAVIAKSAHNHPMFARVLSLTSVLISVLSAVIVIRIVTLIS